MEGAAADAGALQVAPVEARRQVHLRARHRALHQVHLDPLLDLLQAPQVLRARLDRRGPGAHLHRLQEAGLPQVRVLRQHMAVLAELCMEAVRVFHTPRVHGRWVA